MELLPEPIKPMRRIRSGLIVDGSVTRESCLFSVKDSGRKYTAKVLVGLEL
jgi:hypothetical protein